MIISNAHLFCIIYSKIHNFYELHKNRFQHLITKTCLFVIIIVQESHNVWSISFSFLIVIVSIVMFNGKIWRIIPGLDFVDFSTIAHHNLEINLTNQNCKATDPKS